MLAMEVPPMRRAPLRFVLAATLALLFGTAASAGDAEVTVGHNRLDPATLTVKVGTTVVFHNVDAMPGGHTVVADDGSFASPPLAKDESWSHTFEKPGRHPYTIQQHPKTRATIVVE
jgi:plastocyanin